MLDAALKILLAAPAIMQALPEFIALIDKIMDMLDEDDQAVLQKAYELAKADSDEAHTELQELVNQRS